ncbi:hypothetical protein VTK73DRAFT_3777 [Phialemonium thermophilum]|uniref:Uncharacterized protein n=1 Tax=Phialemonium thermophilum TaxID=223376 RepID=A0ABR3VFB0_9PEZI
MVLGLPKAKMKYPFARSAVAAVTLGVASVAAFQYPDCANGPLADTTVCDTEASPRDRAAALVALMKTSEKLVNLVDLSPGVPRIGLPPYEWWSEALHGVALSPGTSFAFQGDEFRYATSFPSPITLSAAFDDDLIYRIASVISTEARAIRAGVEDRR